ncbi:hypothetical protein [Demequina sp.]|uniref:hypothetical protein n=1 Tax=Demequina sp. TaxID=2050685 RepID=UPI0025CE312A|nr:hypothetical protein [Demequina sp.]
MASTDTPVLNARPRAVWAATIAVAAILLAFTVLLPMLGNNSSGPKLEAGAPFNVQDTMTFVPADGWALTSEDGSLFTIFSKGGASLIVLPAVDSTDTLEASAQTAIDGLAADPATTWVLGDPQEFTTDAGVPGIVVVGHSENDFSAFYVISNGTRSVTLDATGPDSTFSTISGELDQMAASVVILEGTAS